MSGLQGGVGRWGGGRCRTPPSPATSICGLGRCAGIRFGLRGDARAAAAVVCPVGWRTKARGTGVAAGRTAAGSGQTRSRLLFRQLQSWYRVRPRAHRHWFDPNQVPKAFCLLLPPPPTSCYLTSSGHWANFRTAEPPAELNWASRFVVLENLVRNINGSAVSGPFTSS